MTAQLDTYRGQMDLVLVMAPFRCDAQYLEQLAADGGLSAVIVTEGELERRLEGLPGILVATHEALTPKVLEIVGAHLASQPDWAELPVLILHDRAAPIARMRSLLDEVWPRARLVFYQRPLTHLELLSGFQSALLSRLYQREVRDHMDRELELRRELSHRVKNLLAIVTSIFALTRRGAQSIEEFSRDFGDRLSALANVHEVAHGAKEAGVPFSDIVEVTLRPYGDLAQRIAADVDDVMLDRNTATTIALCTHELATNAMKYGALSVEGGRVSVTGRVRLGAQPEFSFCWEERGGPEVHEARHEGYGTRYIRTSLHALLGNAPNFDFRPSGLIFTVFGRLPDKAIR